MNLVIYRPFIAIAGIFGALGVALSAMAAHDGSNPNIGTAAQFLLFHAPAFFALAVLSANRVSGFAGWILFAGVAIFAGDLLARAYLDTRLFPMAAPLGGVTMIVGWLAVFSSACVTNIKN